MCLMSVFLHLQESTLECEPGDSLGLICPNPKEEVDVLLERLNLADVCDLPYALHVKEGTSKRNPKIPDFVPKTGTLRELFTWHLDIRSVPKKPLLLCLAEHTSDADQLSRLRWLCSSGASTLYLSLVRGGGLSILDFLLAFPSCQPPVERLIEQLPRLQARPYSIASNQQGDCRKLDIVFNVIQIPQAQGRMFPRRGVCTGWLQDMVNSSEASKKASVNNVMVWTKFLSAAYPLQVHVFGRKKKDFRHPPDLSQPIIMVGPGTGVAPLRGFLQRRKDLIQKRRKDGDSSEGDSSWSWLFFGCRHQEADYLFR